MFTNFLVDQGPHYDKEIIKSMRATDCAWLGHVPTGTFEPFNGTTLSQDRFEFVNPDISRRWEKVDNSACVGSPCDPPEYEIGFGSSRTTYQLQRQSWRSQLFCFDQMLTYSLAKEMLGWLVSDVLKPATKQIMSNLFRRKALELAGYKWLATKAMTPFTSSWEQTGDQEIYLLIKDTAPTNPQPLDPTSKLTASMLQRRYHYQWSIGSRGCADGQDIMLEVVTDLETLWEINKTTPLITTSCGDCTDTPQSHWRFTDWADAAKFFKYGWTGKVGNFAVRADPFSLRFNRVGAGRYQLVPPYINIPATNGIKSIPNPDYANALYQMSFIHNRDAFTALVFRPASVNSGLAFGSRDFGGNWKFAVDNIGCPNPRRNKGYFLADFMLAIKPRHVEWMEAIFHLREPAVVTEVLPTYTLQPPYPAYDYNSANAKCDPTLRVLSFSPLTKPNGTYEIPANSITCGCSPIANALITAATLTALVSALAADSAAQKIGTWGQANGLLTLTGSTCGTVCIPFKTTA